jgi:uncharacterized protein involved in propanediol utilization
MVITQSAHEWALASLRKNGLASDSHMFQVIATAFDAGMIHVLQTLNDNPGINPVVLEALINEFRTYITPSPSREACVRDE